MTCPVAAGVAGAVQTDLQLQLTEQRLHLEQCRIDHITLQSSYQRLEDELAACKDELKTVLEERDRTFSRYKCLLEQSRRNLNDKVNECDEYKLLNPQKVELMRNEIYQKVEELFHLKLEQLSGELQNTRHDFNRVSHELSLCEAELDQEKQEYVRAIEELKRQHELEMSLWEREKESLRHKKSLESTDLTQQLHQLQMENAQLHWKINNLKLQKSDEAGISPDTMTPQPTKSQITDQRVGSIYSREKLRMDQKESGVVGEQLTHLFDEIHELENDRNDLKRQVEELKTQFQLNINSLRLEKMTECNALERRVEELQQSLSVANDDLNALKSNVAVEEEKAKAHSLELRTKLEAEWKLSNILEKEKIELETKLETIERKTMKEEEEQKRFMEAVQERMTNAEQAKEEAEQQASTYRAQLESHQWLLSKAQADYSSTVDLKLQLSRLDADHQSGLREQLAEVDRLSVELHNSKTELIESQTAWTKERQQMQNEIKDLRVELTRNRRQSINNLKFYKGRLKVWQILEKKLKQNLEVVRSDLSKLKIATESAAGDQRPAHASDSATETRRQLFDLVEKHRQFSALLLPTAAENRGLSEAVDQPEGNPDDLSAAVRSKTYVQPFTA